MEELKKWIQDHKINCTRKGAVLFIEDFGKILFIKEKDGKIIDKDFSLILDQDEYDALDNDEEIKYIVFKWGNRFYYCDSNKRKKNEYNEDVIIPKFNPFQTLGKFKPEFEDIQFAHLGIHSGYELLNGSGHPEDWVKKAKFYGYTSIGICEKNTLAGTLGFQLDCNKAKIKSVLGETITVAYDYHETKEFQTTYDVKLYAKNKTGWQNLLRIHKAVNIDYDQFVPLKELLQLSEGLIFVFGRESILYENIYSSENFLKHLKRIQKHVSKDDMYFQIDLTEYHDDNYDIENLQKVKQYFKKLSKFIKPVYIEDSYYIEKIDSDVKALLNKVDRKTEPTSSEQYFKSIDDIIVTYLPLFKSESSEALFLEAIENTIEIADKCNFSIDIGNHKLPKYEVKSGEDKEEYYHNLIAQGLHDKVISKINPKKHQKYFDRINEENEVIINANLIDYFLILHDICDWCRRNDILVGPGRGSAGGSLVAYMLGIIEIDPIEYNLLFERFLNKSRVLPEIFYDVHIDGKVTRLKEEQTEELAKLRKKADKVVEVKVKRKDSMPDIDIDFEGKRRGDVKRYIENRFNINNVCSIGTYTRLKTKSAIKDFGRAKGLEFKKVNYATSHIPDAIDWDYSDIFKSALADGTNELKRFIQENVDICEIMKAPLGQPRSGSVHASAVVIVPKEDEEGNPMEVYDWLPVKKIDGQIISEWEGKYTDQAGFLKEDILGIAQLDKFKVILKLIKQNHGIDLKLEEIPTKEKDVFEYFQKGWNEDVFQFGTSGLKTYSSRVKPNHVEDLISMNALFRPGPMESDAHNDFVEFRRGTKEPHIDMGMELVVKDTQGLYIYQEQVMQAMVVAGMTLVEADIVRTYMKKFDKVNLALFEKKFVEGYGKVLKKNGFKKKIEDEAKKVWDKLNAFSSYGFNRSHAAAYSLMGYWSQYLKVKYPLEFWTASLNFASEGEEIPNRISEIKKIRNGIKIVEADINKSSINFTSEPSTQNIYWSLTKIKGVGDVAVSVILEERAKGEFFSFEDFIKRVPKNKVNKKVVLCLITAGAFDQVSSEKFDIKMQGQAKYRYDLMKLFMESRNEPVPEDIENNPFKKHNWFWRLKQKELTGYGDINYKILAKKKWDKPKEIQSLYKDGEDIERMDIVKLQKSKGERVIIAGRIMKIAERSSRKGEFCSMSIEHNNSVILMTIWNDQWRGKLKSKFKELEVSKRMFAISGELRYDTYKNKPMVFATNQTKIIEL